MAQLAPAAAAQALLQPQQVYTTAYLNNPILFTPDLRFEPVSALAQLNIINIMARDQTDFGIIDLNANTPQYYSATTYTTVNTREAVNRVIDKAFTQFGITTPG